MAIKKLKNIRNYSIMLYCENITINLLPGEAVDYSYLVIDDISNLGYNKDLIDLYISQNILTLIDLPVTSVIITYPAYPVLQ